MLTDGHCRTPIAGLRLALAAAAVLLLSGCYLAHVAAGQMRLSSRRTPIARVLAAPDTGDDLRARLRYAQRAREFAVGTLGLPDNGSYTSYVDVGRRYVTWNVVAAPVDSVEPKQWCFPVAGCVAYRGYFDEARARRYAAGLARRGYDVWVGPVPAYSTLGRLRDPLLSTMLRYRELDIAALIFHELAHQVLYVPGDSAFNEAFATAVEYEGVRRWLAAEGGGGDLESFLAERRRGFQVADLIAESRERLRRIYEQRPPPQERDAARAAEFARLRAAYDALRLSWGASPGPDLFAADPTLNNARLAAYATYHQCLPGLERRLADLGHDLPAFFAEARRLARLAPAERRALLCGADTVR